MKSRNRRSTRRSLSILEPMEPRVLLSAVVASLGRPDRLNACPTIAIHKSRTGAVPHATSPVGVGFNVSQVRHAYGMDQVFFGAIAGDGTGQTIAIIDAYHYPTAQADLATFDAKAIHNDDDPSSLARCDLSLCHTIHKRRQAP